MGSASQVSKQSVYGVAFTLFFAAIIHLAYSLPPEGYEQPVIWFGGGVGIILLIMTSKRFWPLLSLGWLVAFQMRPEVLSITNQLIVATSVGLSSVVAVYFLEWQRFNRALVDVRDVVLLLISTALMSFTLGLVGMVARFHDSDVLVPLTFASLTGSLLTVPVVLAWRYGGPFGDRKRWMHFGACVGSTLLLCVVTALFGEALNLRTFHFLPLLIWAALAFNVRGMAVIISIVGFVTYFATMQFSGPLHQEAVDYANQSIIVTGFTLLVLSAMADHRKENARLADREQRLASIVNTADDGILIVSDKTGLIDSMNPAAEKMFGYSRGESVGLVASDVLFPVGRETLHEAIEEGRAIIARRSDGSDFAAQVSWAEWQNRDGETFYTKIVRDLTAANRAAAELVDREERYRAIVETAVDGIIVINSAGVIQSFNQAADQMFGYEIGEAIGQNVTILMSEQDRLMHDLAIERHEKTGVNTVLGTGGVSVEAKRKDGSLFTAHLAIAEWFVGGERFYTGIMRDLTKQKASEEARDILAREVDHRAKNALAVVQSLVRLTRAKTVEGFIEAVGGRIEALARAHSLLSQGNWSGVSLNQIAEDELAVAAKGSDVSFTGTPVRMTPDAVQPISMLFHELATNAFKYGSLRTPEGSVRVSWKVVADKLVITWQETGVEPITEPEVSGFGSRMMKQVATKQLEGSIDYDWKPTGVQVQVVLPARTFTRSKAEMLTKLSPTAVDPKDGRGRRVLIVEDNALISMEMESSLESNGYDVVGRANSVVEALDLISTTEIDVAVLDVDLGGEYSFAIADVLLEKGVPYTFATGFETLTKERGYEAPVLTKPVNEATLRRTLDVLTGDADDE